MPTDDNERVLNRPEWQRYLDAHRNYITHYAEWKANPEADRPTAERWQEFEKCQAESGRLFDERDAAKRQVLAALHAEDIPALLDAVEGDGITDQQRPIVFVLNDLATARDSRFSDSMKDRWAHLLEHKMARSYPDEGALFSFFKSVDLARARRALLAAFDRLSWPDVTGSAANAVITDAESLGAEGLPILRAMAAQPGDVGATALRALERVEPPSSSKIQEVAARWRATRTREDLDWFYHTIITRYGEGTHSIDQLRELLGEPTDQREHQMMWTTDERGPIALTVGFDQRRMIVSYKLK